MVATLGMLIRGRTDMKTSSGELVTRVTITLLALLREKTGAMVRALDITRR